MADVLSISFEPTTSSDGVNGELTFGGTDPNKYAGPITYTPITNASPSSYYWGYNQSIIYGGTTILSNGAGITDSGTFLILIASNAFDAYQKASGGVIDNDSGLLRITSSQYDGLQNLYFVISGVCDQCFTF
jgi:cathepsin E